MVEINWFSGGKERRDDAITIVDDLLSNLTNPDLKKVLLSYREELKKQEIATPFILSRMNLALSQKLIEKNIRLPEAQSNQLKRLRNLLNIRYIPVVLVKFKIAQIISQ
ncbi:bacteriocin immunity protein [Streptococcus anginosus]|uniref:bacteriocin immunity protein n=1 Tax=Streptococcus anginosus TaxID=1328 RepID=UPI000FEF5743|nr:bacteriocin immunity protein [Streptococcus anginosus]RHE87369.1 bacteriocin immunity protein [Streptococcus anginosus]